MFRSPLKPSSGGPCPYFAVNLIRPDVFHIKTKYNRFSSNTSITSMKYSLDYMFRSQNKNNCFNIWF
jgi:hypothetical protein